MISNHRGLLVRGLDWEAAKLASGTVRCRKAGELRPWIKGHEWPEDLRVREIPEVVL